jgi:hypothetical protein
VGRYWRNGDYMGTWLCYDRQYTLALEVLPHILAFSCLM